MNVHWQWLAEKTELLTFFAITPAVAIAITYKAWREEGRDPSPKLYGVRCAVWSLAAFLLFVFANWIVADAGTPTGFQLFLHFACAVLSLLSFGVCVGCSGALFLHMWRWHKRTRLT
jgi:hypothetical protein